MELRRHYASMVRSAVFVLAASFAVSGATSVKHVFVCVDNGGNKLIKVDQVNGGGWSVSIPSGSRDLTLLGGNRVLVSHGNGAAEYDLATGAKTGWAVTNLGSVNSARRLANGNTLFGIVSGKLIEVNKDGVKVGEVTLTGMNDLRLIRLVPETGNVLLTAVSPYRAIEVTRAGAEVWSAPLPGKGYVAERLANGNTLATTGETNTIVEITPAKETVWQAGLVGDVNKDQRLLWFSGFSMLANGNTVIANWCGHNKEGQGPHLVEFDHDNNLVWSWEDHVMAKTVTNVLVLDDGGTGALWRPDAARNVDMACSRRDLGQRWFTVAGRRAEEPGTAVGIRVPRAGDLAASGLLPHPAH